MPPLTGSYEVSSPASAVHDLSVTSVSWLVVILSKTSGTVAFL